MSEPKELSRWVSASVFASAMKLPDEGFQDSVLMKGRDEFGNLIRAVFVRATSAGVKWSAPVADVLVEFEDRALGYLKESIWDCGEPATVQVGVVFVKGLALGDVPLDFVKGLALGGVPLDSTSSPERAVKSKVDARWVSVSDFAMAMKIPASGSIESVLMTGRDEAGNLIPSVYAVATNEYVRWSHPVAEVLVERKDRENKYLSKPAWTGHVTKYRNAQFLMQILDGSSIADVARNSDLTQNSVRRIFLNECLARAPDVYAEGWASFPSNDPPIHWFQQNKDRILAPQRPQIGPDEIKIQEAIKLAERVGQKVSGTRPITLQTAVTDLAKLSPRSKLRLVYHGIRTLEDACSCPDEKLKTILRSDRPFDHLKYLRSIV